MDWVEQRAKRDKAIIKNRQKLWDGLRTALQSAVQSFNRCYRHEDDAEFSAPYPDHAWVRLRGQSEYTAHFILTLERTIEVEVVARGNITTKLVLSFSIDEKNEAALAVDGKLLTAEQISRIALEPVLFSEATELYPMILENVKY